MTARFCLLFLTIPVLAADTSVPWHHPLYLANHGYWPRRVAVQVFNNGTNAAAGEPLLVSIPGLAGLPAESVRVCNRTGQELLFDVIDGRGLPRRSGYLASGDRYLIPAECGPQSNATAFVYAGNRVALAVPDFLRSGLLNGGFESGGDLPGEWVAANDDAKHRVAWESSRAHGGSRCVKVEVDTGASSTWVQWRQVGIPVTPGRAYEFTAWVRSENVEGRSGWFVHVDGQRAQEINQVVTTEGGTHDWKQVIVKFTAPASSRTASVGTVLYGTGKAWFDDAALVSVSDPLKLRAIVGPIEELTLSTNALTKPNLSDAWPVCAVARVHNVNDLIVGPALVSIDMRPTLGRWFKVLPGATARVQDALSGEVIPAVRVDNSLLFSATLPARSIREYHVLLNPRQKADDAALSAGYERLLNGLMNLVPSPSFEGSGSPPAGWSFDAGRMALLGAGVTNDARFGRAALRFSVPSSLPAAWSGWRTGEIPVRPGSTYFYSGFLKASGLDGSTTLHGHFHNGRGQLTSSGAMIGTHPQISGDAGWTRSSAFIEAPPDAASIQLHLTANLHGTLQHDGILLCEVIKGEVVRLDADPRSSRGNEALEQVRTDQSLLTSAATGIEVSQVNPLIKVFPDDPPAPVAASLAVECGRNEYEPMQLVLRSGAPMKNLEVKVSSLRDGSGKALPAVQVDRVGYVPVDHPSGYYQTKVEDWQRKVPRGAGSTDGWAGMWPDPLVPAGTCDVAANQNQPFWLTVRASRDTAPGDYLGSVTFHVEGKTVAALPLMVRVLPFTLPERTKLRAILDFRFGPGGQLGSGDSSDAARRKWLRFLAEHRLGIDGIEPAPKFTYTNGQVQMDARAFDETARFCFDELGMNGCYTPWFLYMFGWAYPPKKLFGHEPFAPEWISAFKQVYGLLSAHLKEKGWHDRFVYYISDEPHFHHPFVVEQMKKLCALIHEVDPKIPIYSSTWRHCPDWDDSIDLWGVGQYGCFPVEQMERVRRAGRGFWFTCDGQMATDTPYLATERMLPYYCLKYGAGGFEFWGIAWWTYDPWRLGWHTFIRQSDDGKEHYWIRYPNGDGFLTYPGKAVGVEGPVSTIRLEQVREGLEDFEALSLLTELVEQGRKSGRSVVAGERALALAKNLVTIPNAGGLRSSEVLSDPDQIPAIRKLVNAALVELAR